MSRPPGRRLVTYAVALMLLCGAAIAGVSYYGPARRVYRTVGAVTDATVDRAEVETPEKAYTRWRTTGVRGRRVLFFAGEWEKIAPERFFDVPLERNYPLALFNYGKALEEQRLDRRSFLYVATVTGIVREMGVVLPEAIYRHLEEQARSAKNARFLDGAISFTYHGLPRTFLTLRHFRAPAEPVLVYVGASFFREHTPEELRAALVSAGVRTDSLILCRMAGDERVTPEERERLAAFARLIGMSAGSGGPS